MNGKERLLFDAAQSILRDECPPDTKYYFCWKSRRYRRTAMYRMLDKVSLLGCKWGGFEQ